MDSPITRKRSDNTGSPGVGEYNEVWTSRFRQFFLVVLENQEGCVVANTHLSVGSTRWGPSTNECAAHSLCPTVPDGITSVLICEQVGKEMKKSAPIDVGTDFLFKKNLAKDSVRRSVAAPPNLVQTLIHSISTVSPCSGTKVFTTNSSRSL